MSQTRFLTMTSQYEVPYCTDTLLHKDGSIEVIADLNQNNNDVVTGGERKKKNETRSKKNCNNKTNQLSTMMRRMKKPPRRQSTSNKQGGNNNPLVKQIQLRKSQSARITPKGRHGFLPQRPKALHVRSSSDCGTYDYSVASCNESNHNNKNKKDARPKSSITPQECVETTQQHDDSAHEQYDNNILMVSSSVSEEDNILGNNNKHKPRRELQESSTTLQSFYDMVTSSWRIDEHDKENAGLDLLDSKLVKEESSLTGETTSQFFFKEDFDTSTWFEVNNGISIFGAAVMTATVVIHPLVFAAGAATAVWAVGFLHGLEKG